MGAPIQVVDDLGRCRRAHKPQFDQLKLLQVGPH